MNFLNISSLTHVFFAVYLVWLATSAMLQKRKILVFMPFFIAGLASCFYAGFVLYEIFVNTAWLFIEFLYLVSIIWMFIVVGRKINE